MLCPWSRTCKKCKEYFPITAFSFRKDSQTYRFFCKKCRTLSNKEYFLKNPNKKIESIRKKRIHYKKNSKRLIAQRNKAIFNKNWNQWRTKNKERLNKNRKLRRIYDAATQIGMGVRGAISGRGYQSEFWKEKIGDEVRGSISSKKGKLPKYEQSWTKGGNALHEKWAGKGGKAAYIKAAKKYNLETRGYK